MKDENEKLLVDLDGLNVVSGCRCFAHMQIHKDTSEIT